MADRRSLEDLRKENKDARRARKKASAKPSVPRRGPDREPSKASAAMRKLGASVFWRDWGPGACMAGAALLVLLAGVVLSGVWARRLDALESDLRSELGSAMAAAEAAAREAESGNADPDGGADSGDAMSGVASGQDTDGRRRDADDRIAADMLRHALTWDSRASYEASRKELLSRYDWLDMQRDPDFLLSFFPPGEDTYSRIGGEIVADPFSDGRNVSFSSMETYLLEERPDGRRSYLAVVRVRSRGQVGGTAESSAVATYETDAEGAVWDMRCYSM